MCNHGTSQKSEVVKLDLPMVNQERIANKYIYTGWDKPFLPVISIDRPQVIDSFRWMLIPGYVRDEKKFKANTLNARNDKLFATESYRHYWQNRCIVLLTGFFEPHYENLSDPSHKNQSWYLSFKDKSIMKLGGIFSPFQGINTFAIVTVDASPLQAEVHNEGMRAPLILDDESEKLWMDKSLDKETMARVMVPYEHDELLSAYRVRDGVFNTRVDSNVPEVIEPWKPNPLPPLPLFPNGECGCCLDYENTEMEEIVTLTLDLVLDHIGKEIYYYELWTSGEFPFVGKALINGVEKDRHNDLRITCSILWGSDLWEAKLNEDDFFVYGEDERPIYFGAPPFEIHKIQWNDEGGEANEKLIIIHPGEHDAFFADTVKLITNRPYKSTRVH